MVVVNTGKTAAYAVSGWLLFDLSRVEPLDYFCDGRIEEERTPDGRVRVQVGGGERDDLLPTTTDRLVYDIALKVHSAGPTKVGYEFVSRFGKDSDGSWELEIPSP